MGAFLANILRQFWWNKQFQIELANWDLEKTGSFARMTIYEFRICSELTRHSSFCSAFLKNTYFSIWISPTVHLRVQNRQNRHILKKKIEFFCIPKEQETETDSVNICKGSNFLLLLRAFAFQRGHNLIATTTPFSITRIIGLEFQLY